MWCVFSHTIGTKPALACLNIVSVLQAQSHCVLRIHLLRLLLLSMACGKGAVFVVGNITIYGNIPDSLPCVYIYCDLKWRYIDASMRRCVYTYFKSSIPSFASVTLELFWKPSAFWRKFLDVIELRNCFSWLLDHLVIGIMIDWWFMLKYSNLDGVVY